MLRARCSVRTANMWSISVTLDVLKLRGWLNACDSCARLKPRGEPVGEKVQWQTWEGRVLPATRRLDRLAGPRAHRTSVSWS